MGFFNNNTKQDDLKLTQDKLQQAEQKIRILQAELAAKISELEAVLKTNSKILIENHDLEKDLRQTKLSFQANILQQSATERELASSKFELKNIQKKQASLESELFGLKRELDRLSTENIRLENLNRDYATQYNKSCGGASQSSKKIIVTDLEKNYKIYEVACNNLRAHIAKLEAQISKLELKRIRNHNKLSSWYEGELGIKNRKLIALKSIADKVDSHQQNYENLGYFLQNRQMLKLDIEQTRLFSRFRTSTSKKIVDELIKAQYGLRASRINRVHN